jgi:hypothetical protein
VSALFAVFSDDVVQHGRMPAHCSALLGPFGRVSAVGGEVWAGSGRVAALGRSADGQHAVLLDGDGTAWRRLTILGAVESDVIRVVVGVPGEKSSSLVFVGVVGLSTAGLPASFEARGTGWHAVGRTFDALLMEAGA